MYKTTEQYQQEELKNIIVGIGCRRGVSKEKIENAVKKALVKVNFTEKNIKALSTIPLKKDEEGLLDYVGDKPFNLKFIAKKRIKKSDLTVNPSSLVQDKIGVPGVCEAAALLSANGGKLILEKTVYDQVTIAIAKEENPNEHS